ncbi:MAG: hypothetical protein K2R98_19385 [Gemmataceae bacterium]|nr:hypothetical protein [Gemmataceae bacterium]
MRMNDPSKLKHAALANMVRAIQSQLYRDDRGNVNPDKSINGADFVDFVIGELAVCGLTPEEE